MLNRVLLTGATGFIGRKLAEQLKSNEEIHLSLLGRKEASIPAARQYTQPISSSQNYLTALSGAETVIHLAAIPDTEASVDEVREINVKVPTTLAQQAKESGVKRFIFLSSVKAMGESTMSNSPYKYNSECSPEDLYGVSKRDAELALKNELEGSETELVIIRPPLVYGPGVKGNFKALMGLAKKNLPLPFASVENKRSLVSLDNLVSLIVTCVKHPEPLNGTFLVSDDHDVSSKELFETLTRAYGKDPKLWPFPVSLMKLSAKMLGKKKIADRLFGNLQLDINHTKKALNWEPPVTFNDAIQKCVKAENN